MILNRPRLESGLRSAGIGKSVERWPKERLFHLQIHFYGYHRGKDFPETINEVIIVSCVVDEKEDVERLFSADNLKQLFEFQPNTPCDTHDTYSCKRCRPDTGQFIKSPAMLYGDSTTWNHLNHDALNENEDILLRNEE